MKKTWAVVDPNGNLYSLHIDCIASLANESQHSGFFLASQEAATQNWMHNSTSYKVVRIRVYRVYKRER